MDARVKSAAEADDAVDEDDVDETQVRAPPTTRSVKLFPASATGSNAGAAGSPVVGPGAPCGPVAPGNPVAPTGPVAPASPVVPCDPGAPCGPVGPMGPPDGPTGPTGPGIPAGPADPTRPAGPAGPGMATTLAVLLDVPVVTPVTTVVMSNLREPSSHALRHRERSRSHQGETAVCPSQDVDHLGLNRKCADLALRDRP